MVFDANKEPAGYHIHGLGINWIKPVDRVLFTPDEIESVSSDLLAIHRAIVTILYLSGAGLYIEDLLRENEEIGDGEDLS
ncbi:uncharacterized protein BDV17DRAFT_274658 [Aspergillus undulatus]|uniref:uncharacterized protein n=1 Tax=Aspergillus undulatus TaxID=1810928 RepID=UPI003CCD0810